MKKNILFALFFFLNLLVPLGILTLTSCSTTDPKLEPDLKLELKDVSCTEAWLQLTTRNIQLPATINLLNNNVLSQVYVLNTQDSLLYIDSLLPNQSYKFKVVANTTYNPQPTTNEVLAQTMDTTSHSFTWQIFELGNPLIDPSIIYDVAIINENNIWAVGEIYMNDSLGNPDPEPYAVAHWNGSGWDLKKLKFNCRLYYPNCGPETLLVTPAYSIFARNENDIWISAASVHHFNGTIWSEEAGILGAGDAHKIWGNANELWFVGSAGFIAHQSSSKIWTRIESGTNSIIGDAWGVSNSGISTIYCVVSSFFEPQKDRKILKITNGKVDSVSWKENRLLYSCWTNSNKYLYVCGSGVYNNKSGQWYQEDLPAISMNRIRGNALNDIFLIGDFGFASHFNGVSWQIYNENFGDIWGLLFKQDIVSFVGQKNGYGYIVIGKR